MATSPPAEPIWRALASARALSPIGLAIWLSVSGLRYISRSLAVTNDDLAVLVVHQVLTVGTAVIAAIIVRKALCRNASYRIGIGRTLICYLAVLVLVSVVQWFVSDSLGITNGPSVIRFSSALVLMYLVGGLLDLFANYREVIQQLKQEQRDLVRLRIQFAARLQSLRSQVVAETWARIGGAWQVAGNRLQNAQQAGEITAGQLQSLAEYIRSELIEPIRSFSYQVERLKIDDADSADSASIPAGHSWSDWRQIIRTTTPVVGPYYPFAVGATFFVFAMVNFEDAGETLPTVLGCAATSIIAAMILVGVRHWFLPLIQRLTSNAMRWLVYLLTLFALNTVILYVFTEFLRRQGILSPGIVTAPLSSIVILFWAFLSSLSAKVAEVQARLHQVIALTRQENLALEQEMAATRQQLAHILHGEVQTKLTAAALRLDVGVELIPPGHNRLQGKSAETTIEQAQMVLQSAAEHVDAIASTPARQYAHNQGVIDQVEELRRAWAGIIDVTLTIPVAAASLIDTRVNDASLTAVVADIVREAILNAVRHAGARQAAVTIETADGICQITVENDGEIPKVQRTPGLGQNMLNRSTRSWSLDSKSSGGAVLQVEIPLLAAAQSLNG